MKKLLLLPFLTLLVSCGTLQVFDTPSKIDAVIQVESNKHDTYIRANEWMVEAFNNAKSVIQFSDKEEGIIKGKYIFFDSNNQYFKDGYAIITVRVKDGAAKITIDPSGAVFSDFTISGGNHAEGMVSGNRPETFNDKALALIISFETRLKEIKEDF